MLQTDWLKVGTAGRTIDGREIKGEWLEQMARLYAPAIYTAGVNSEHFFYPGLGHVTALKAGRDELGRMALYARLAPTSELLARYQNKRQLFFSMEIRSDFPAKGDVYLTGLAITDVPASQGLEPARYAAGEDGLERFFDTASLEDEAAPELPGSGEAPPGWWGALWQALRPHFAGRGHEHPQEDSDQMTKAEQAAFEALKEEVTALKAQVAELEGRYSAGGETEGGGEPEPAAAALEQFAGEVDQKLAEALAPLAERLEKLEAYLAEPADIERGEVTGPAPGGEPFVF